MTADLVALCVDATDPRRLAGFWSGVLGADQADDPGGGTVLTAGGHAAFQVRFRWTAVPKAGRNQLHLHLTSTSLEDQQRTVARALAGGGRHLDVGQRPEEGHVVFADPEGNEFCVIEPGNRFLAGCGFLGELACDGAPEVGYFWSAALDWPLVWDQDQETAIQSPSGGTKIAWGGPPEEPRTPGTPRNRMHLDVAPRPGGDQQAVVERLVALGATRAGPDRDRRGPVVMADPGGNEFCVLPRR